MADEPSIAAFGGANTALVLGLPRDVAGDRSHPASLAALSQARGCGRLDGPGVRRPGLEMAPTARSPRLAGFIESNLSPLPVLSLNGPCAAVPSFSCAPGSVTAIAMATALGDVTSRHPRAPPQWTRASGSLRRCSPSRFVPNARRRSSGRRAARQLTGPVFAGQRDTVGWMAALLIEDA